MEPNFFSRPRHDGTAQGARIYGARGCVCGWPAGACGYAGALNSTLARAVIPKRSRRRPKPAPSREEGAASSAVGVCNIWLRIYHRRLNHWMMPKHSAGIHSSSLPLVNSEKPADSFCTLGRWGVERRLISAPTDSPESRRGHEVLCGQLLPWGSG